MPETDRRRGSRGARRLARRRVGRGGGWLALRSRRVFRKTTCSPWGGGGWLGVVFVGVFSRFPEDGFHVSPVAAGFDDDEFVSAASLAEFGSIGGGRNADGRFVNERAALRLGEGDRRGDEEESSGEKDESKSHIHDYWP